MSWKMINIKLQKGAFFPSHGDSALFFKVICHKQALI